MNGRVGDAQRGLRRHAGLKCIVDRRNDVAHIVQTTEYAGDVHTLSVLHLVHQLAHISRHGEHTQSVQTTVEHVGLDAHLIKRFGKGAYRLVRVLAIKQVNLFKGTTVGFNTGEATHLYDNRCYAFKLVLARLKLAAALEHVAIDKTELNLTLCHYSRSIYYIYVYTTQIAQILLFCAVRCKSTKNYLHRAHI